jgi:hypothetical protein
LGQEAISLEPSTEPKNTTFSFTPPPGDPNFEDIIDPEQVNLLFGISANVIISQTNIKTLAPIILTDSSRVPDIQSIGRPFHQRKILFSSKIRSPRYSLFGNQANMDDQEDHNNVRHGEERNWKPNRNYLLVSNFGHHSQCQHEECSSLSTAYLLW